MSIYIPTMKNDDNYSPNIEDLLNSVEVVTNHIETVSSLNDIMQSSIDEKEGLSHTAIELTTIVTESICKQLGISSVKLGPSLESYGSKYTKIEGTRLALENTKQFITRLWTIVIKLFKHIQDVIVNYLNEFIYGLKNLKDEYATVNTNVKEYLRLGNKVPKVTEIYNPSLARAFTLIRNDAGKPITNSHGMIKILSNHIKLSKTLFSQMKSFLDYGLTVIEIDEKGVKSISYDHIDIGIDVTDPLINLSSCSIENRDASNEADYLKIVQHYNENTTGMVEVLTYDTLKIVMRYIFELIEINQIFIRQHSMITSVLTKYQREAQFQLKKMSQEDQTLTVEEARLKKEELTRIHRFIMTVSTQIPSLNIQAIKASLKYVSLSLTQYE